jgi:uncharacterized protein YndB with AHSA1/START domain
MTIVQRSTLVGSTYEVDGLGTVHVEDRFDTGIDDLWGAVTDPERLARWLATVEGDLRPGGAFTARFTSSWEGPGRVEVCEAPHRLLVTLEPGTDDETRIEALLTPDGDGTRLVVEERGFPLDRVGAHRAGWVVHIEDLGAHLEGREPSVWVERWREIQGADRTPSA